jgi:beta-lactamase regulating signal transducer with metallopeptidase domain
MRVGLDWFGQILVDATLATAILLSLVILLMLLCPQPTRRIVLAQTAIVLALIMFPLIAANPLPRLNTLAWFIGLDPAVSRIRSSASEAGVFPIQSPHDQVTQGRSTNGSAGQGTWWTGPWPHRVLALVYMTGVSVAMFWTLLGFWGIQRLVGRSVEPSPATRAIYDELSQEMDERLPFPGLRVSALINRPVLVGVFRSFIVIPPVYDEQSFDKESLKIILLHELAHAARGDTYFSAAASLAQSLWFFLPFLWWVRAQLRIDQEFLADQKVVMLTGSPAGYATRLVALATQQKGPHSPWTTEKSLSLQSRRWANGGFHSPLLQRVLMLLHCPYPLELKPPRWWAMSAPLLVVGLAILSVWVSLALVDRPPPSAGASFVADTPNSFRITQFIASPQKSNSRAHSSLYTLPLPLPPHFVLDVEIHASRAALSEIRLVGLALVSPPPAGSDAGGDLESTSSAASWHQIQVRRQAGRLLLTVDGKTIPVGRDSEILSQWLTVEPASNETAILRNLLLTW